MTQVHGMSTTAEIMMLVEMYASCVLRVATGQTNRPESISVEARATLLKAVEALVADAEFGRSMRLSTIIATMKEETP